MGCCAENTVTPESSDTSKDNASTVPVKERIARDIPFLMMYIIMIGIMAYLCHYSFRNGDPYRFVNGSDSWGNVCGRNNTDAIKGVPLSGRDHSEREFAFHMGLANIKTAMNPLSYLRSKTKPAIVCVKECPQELTDCRDLLDDNGYTNISESFVDQHICTMPYDLLLPHSSLLNRCVPNQLLQVVTAGQVGIADNSTSNMNGTQSRLESMATTAAKHILTSMLKYWKDTIYLSVVAFFLCFVIMIFFQFFTRILVIMCVVVGGFGSFMVTIFLWYNYGIVQGYITEDQLKDVYDRVSPAADKVVDFVNARIQKRISLVNQVSNQALNVTVPSSDVLANVTINTVHLNDFFDLLPFDSIKNSDYLLPWALFSTGVTFVILLIMYVVRKSVGLVIKIFDEASLAIISMPCVLFEPVKALCAYTAISVYFFIVAAHIIAIQGPVVDDRGFVSFDEKNGTSITALFFAHLFGCLWTMQFISGCQQIIIAGAICEWFFIRSEERRKKSTSSRLSTFTNDCKISPILRANSDLVQYHLGTVAFGSLVIGFIQTLRVGIAFLRKHLQGKESKAAKKIISCLRCCLLCFEKFMKFINRNAYICAAMYGSSFFQSGKKALTLLINNAKHAIALNCISNFCMFLGKVAVVAITIFISVAYFKYYRLDDGALLSEYFVPLLTVAIASFFIAQGFFAVYDTTLDAIFLCFCDDQERNNGDDRPYYSSARLQKYMSGGPNKSRSVRSTRTSRKSRSRVPYKSTLSVSAGSNYHPTSKKNDFQTNFAKLRNREKLCGLKNNAFYYPRWFANDFPKKVICLSKDESNFNHVGQY